MIKLHNFVILAKQSGFLVSIVPHLDGEGPFDGPIEQMAFENPALYTQFVKDIATALQDTGLTSEDFFELANELDAADGTWPPVEALYAPGGLFSQLHTLVKSTLPEVKIACPAMFDQSPESAAYMVQGNFPASYYTGYDAVSFHIYPTSGATNAQTLAARLDILKTLHGMVKVPFIITEMGEGTPTFYPTDMPPPAFYKQVNDWAKANGTFAAAWQWYQAGGSPQLSVSDVSGVLEALGMKPICTQSGYL